jgi:hypothetical protein
MASGSGAGLRCPVCGVGVLGDIAYDDHRPTLPPGKQAPEAREMLSFSCGHEVPAHRLAEAARDDPNVERRTSEETVTPPAADGGPR